MFTDAEFERRFRKPRTIYETIRSAVLKTSKFDAVYNKWEASGSTPAPFRRCPLQMRR
jgi:hypothetical protein